MVTGHRHDGLYAALRHDHHPAPLSLSPSPTDCSPTPGHLVSGQQGWIQLGLTRCWDTCSAGGRCVWLVTCTGSFRKRWWDLRLRSLGPAGSLTCPFRVLLQDIPTASRPLASDRCQWCGEDHAVPLRGLDEWAERIPDQGESWLCVPPYFM